ncbi:F-box/LRR-repeat protein 17 [Dendropsophus ebraccatus]|uniref:F-box/LRR-repeat protein 17 n=1 Tax=Dendropsophus ebraccatus TaxID=150705 RepID=UPI0038310953
MGSFFCKQRRGLTPTRDQQRKKLQRRDCLLRAPCMLCFIVREPAVSEPVPCAPPAQRPAAIDCAHLLLLNSLQEQCCSVLLPGLPTEETDMVCKRKNSGENQQPGTPCKQPRCTPAGEQAPERACPCPGGHSHCTGNQGHASPQNPEDHTPSCSGGDQGNIPSIAGDQGHPSTWHPQDHPQPAADPALPCTEGPSGQAPPECTEKDCMPLLEERCGTEPRCTSCHGTSSQDQLQTVRDADPDAARVEEEPLNINQLPPSLLLKIFFHLSLNERCLCVSLVCKYWRDLCLDFQFWKQLDLSSHGQMKDDILERIGSRFRNILEINISDCLNVTDAGIEMVAAKCMGLVKYTAYRCKQLSDSSLISLATYCTSLQKVHVGNQDRLTDEAIKQLGSRCKDLKDIHFGQCYKISDEGLVCIAKGCPKLKKIYLQENKLVSDKSVEAFAEHCPELEYVGFMGCSVTSRGVISLTNLKNLSSLDLRHINELDNETVMEIVKKCQNLTSLNLCLNRNIDDRCVEVIAKEGRSLKELYLVTCKITDHALIAIGRYSTTIETVDVGWCKEITDQGATLIAQSSKSIRYLGLMRCDQVNEATVEQLVQQYPHITFSTVLQDCKRTLERAYQMGWTPNTSSAS